MALCGQAWRSHTGSSMVWLLAGLLRLAEAVDLTYTVAEELPPGTPVGSLSRDTDLTQYVSADSLHNLRFSFLASDPAVTSHFRLEEATGTLSTARTGRLDREALCPYSKHCVLSLQIAIQSTLNQFFKKVSVDINVTDVNDNAPTFPAKSAEVVISEKVSIPSSFPLMSALDLDTGGQNGLQDYQLLPPGGPFGLGFTLGGPNLLLVVERPELDHERQDRYTLHVVARDGGNPPRSGTLVVNVTVADENDNEPQFTEAAYAVTVDEDVSPGFVLLAVSATDRDSGDNGRVRYRLSLQQARDVLTMFSMDPLTGQLSLAGNIEKASKETYDVMVEASDLGARPFTSSTTVTVTVRDTINSPPRMTVSNLAGGNGFSTISEYASLGAVVAHVAVRDGDRGRNGIVQCDLDPHPYFELQGFDVNEYKVIVARALDREAVSVHNVTLRCSDAGLRPLTTSATFHVQVLDENDNSPRFSHDSYRLSLPENSRQGRSVLTVRATDNDADNNGKVRYSLHPNARGRFIISADTGVILTHDEFDYELETTFNFTVIATDGGRPARSQSCEVLVSITDLNDQKPTFARDVFPFSVSESARHGKVVGRITANDFERGVNGQVVILPEKPTANGTPFSVTHNGSIILTGDLDHEAVTYFYFRVVAMDQGTPPLNDTAEVQITVLDENDNRPSITYPNGSDLHLYVSMKDDIARPLVMMKATDPDSGLNGQIQYIITSRNDSGRFDVDANSGEVFVTRSLTRSDVSTYRLQVLVQDSGTPPQQADRAVTLWIHAGNGTREESGPQSADTYLLITLAIVCVTVILSAVIVLVMVLVRRKDRRRKPPAHAPPVHSCSRALGVYTDRVMKDNMLNECVDEGLADKEYGGEFHTFGKGLGGDEGDFGFSSFNAGGGKNVDTYISNSLNQQLSADDEKSTPTVDELPAPVTKPKVSATESNLDSDTPHPRQKPLQSSHESSQPVRCVEEQNVWRPSARQEDGQSDSSGETIPSDSGRGGSEEDLNHTGHGGTALHDVSFLSTLSHPSRSSVRMAARSSNRKHVTFKDLSSGRRGPRSLGASPNQAQDSGRRVPAYVAERSCQGGSEARYTPLPNRDSPRTILQGAHLQQEAGDTPPGGLGDPVKPESSRNTAVGTPGRAASLDSSSEMSAGVEPARRTHVYANESFRVSKDRFRQPAVPPPRCLLGESHPLLPYCGPASSTELRGVYVERQQQQNEGRSPRDWRQDTAASSDDCEEQPFTALGSYNLDHDDSDVGHDPALDPWKDVVV